MNEYPDFLKSGRSFPELRQTPALMNFSPHPPPAPQREGGSKGLHKVFFAAFRSLRLPSGSGPSIAGWENRSEFSHFGWLWRRGSLGRSGFRGASRLQSFFAPFRPLPKLMSFPFVLAFGIGQKIPPFRHFKIEYRKNGFLSTQKHRNALNPYRKVCRQD